MSFAAPAFLWALFALSLPILIHLLELQLRRKVAFTRVAFLREVEQQSHRQRKVRRWLILLLRLLAMTFLILAFARPLWGPRAATENGPTVLYLDDSWSLQAYYGEQTNWARAQGFAQTLLDRSDPLSEWRIEGNELTAADRQTLARPEALDRVAEFTPGASAAAPQKLALRRGARQGGGQCLFVSDFQTSTWDSEGFDALLSDSSQSIVLVPLAPDPSPNLFVDSLWLETPYLPVGQENKLMVRIRNGGSEPAKDVPIRLLLEGIQQGQATVSVPAGGRSQLSFSVAFPAPGLVRGRIVLTDQGPSFDDEFFFTLEVAPEVQILLLGAASDVAPVRQAYEREPLFRTESRVPEQMDPAALAEADVVVWVGMGTPNADQVSQLTDYLAEGGSLLLFPSGQAQPSSWLSLGSGLSRWNDASRQAISPPQADGFFEGVFQQIGTRSAMPEARPVLRLGRGLDPVLRFSSGQVFMGRQSVEGGQLYLCAAPLGADYTPFARHWSFLPVLYRIAFLSPRLQQQVALRAGEGQIVLRLGDRELGEEPVRLVKGKTQLIPTQRRSGGRLLLQWPATPLEAGHYAVCLGQDTLSWLGLNAPVEESLLESPSAEALRAQVGERGWVRVVEGEQGAELAQSVRQLQTGHPLWKYCVVLALACLLGEILLLRRQPR